MVVHKAHNLSVGGSSPPVATVFSSGGMNENFATAFKKFLSFVVLVNLTNLWDSQIGRLQIEIQRSPNWTPLTAVLYYNAVSLSFCPSQQRQHPHI